MEAGKPPDPSRLPIFLRSRNNPPAITAVPDKSRVQDNVTLAETLKLNRFNPDYYALEVGNHVLGGGFYATRLYQDLRENAGLVYYVSSSFRFGKTRGVYEVSYACDPPNVSKARAIIVRDLKEMRTKPVSPAELRQAKAMLLREIPLSESSVDSIAGGLIYRSASACRSMSRAVRPSLREDHRAGGRKGLCQMDSPRRSCPGDRRPGAEVARPGQGIASARRFAAEDGRGVGEGFALPNPAPRLRASTFSLDENFP